MPSVVPNIYRVVQTAVVDKAWDANITMMTGNAQGGGFDVGAASLHAVTAHMCSAAAALHAPLDSNKHRCHSGARCTD
jgi:cephalosporin-C deacetylase-like acetyl esterase